MRSPLVVLAALASIAGGHAVRALALDEAATNDASEPYAPSPAAAPFVSVGYRELLGDLLFFRLIGYFGGKHHTASGVAALVEAIVAAAPDYEKIYVWGPRAILASRRDAEQAVRHGAGEDARREASNATTLRAIAILEAGTRRFPDDYKIFETLGETYLFDLETQDPAQRRAWNERAADLLEAAVHKPNAPADAARLAAHLRSKLGQRQRAIDNLREMLLITNDDGARASLLDKLAELEHRDARAIASELLETRRKFETAWNRERPAVPASTYVLVGPPIRPGFDLGELATGGRDLLDADSFAPADEPPLEE